MNKVKRTTANLPRDLLRETTAITGKGITETIIRGLELIKRSRAHELAKNLRGKIRIDVDLEVSRERTNR